MGLSRHQLQWKASRRNAFTLLEALVASVVLALVVLAVGAAVSAGQVSTLKGTSTILASMAADDLMNELASLPYDQLVSYDGFTQQAGAITSLQGTPYPQSYYSISRSAEVFVQIIQDAETGARVRGTTIRVVAAADAQSIITIETFIAEPPLS